VWNRRKPASLHGFPGVLASTVTKAMNADIRWLSALLTTYNEILIVGLVYSSCHDPSKSPDEPVSSISH
jgi:hypothetical protein